MKRWHDRNLRVLLTLLALIAISLPAVAGEPVPASNSIPRHGIRSSRASA